jgi:chromosome partitioning protein
MGLDGIRYAPKRFAQLLGLTTRELANAEASGPLLALRPLEAGETKPTYSPADLVRYREVLGRQPEPLPFTRQLFLNFKGGTGKTSVSTSYAFRLAEMGHKVLVIDLDSQGHATKVLGLEPDEYEKTLADALIRRVPVRDVIVPTGYPGLDVIPSNLAMSTVDLALMPLAGREFRLRNVLKEVESAYDVIVFDAPPSFGLLNLNALVAADTLVVPVLADFLSFHGLKLLFETVGSLEEDLQHVLSHIFIVVNGFNATYKIAKESRDALVAHYGDYLLENYVRQDSRFAQASSEGAPVFAYDPESKGAEDIDGVLGEICARIRAASVAAPAAKGA